MKLTIYIDKDLRPMFNRWPVEPEYPIPVTSGTVFTEDLLKEWDDEPLMRY